MPRAETLSVKEYGEHIPNFPFLEQLVAYVTTEDPEILKKELLAKTEVNPALDTEKIGEAISFMELAHEGQERRCDTQEGKKKPFIVHTLACTLMVNEVMGETVSTDSLIVALLHDSIEDGEIPDEKQTKRAVTKKDIAEKFGERVANGVEALSIVRDELQKNGELHRRKLTHAEYATRIEAAHRADATLGLITIKVGGDRPTNILDPFRMVKPPTGDIFPKTKLHHKNEYTSRKKNIANTQECFLPLVTDPKLSTYIQNYLDLARLTCTANFKPENWKTQLKNFQKK